MKTKAGSWNRWSAVELSSTICIGYAALSSLIAFQPLRPCGGSKQAVKLQTSQVEKPFEKLRKQLSEFPCNAHPEDVHSLRAQTRRLEATIAALLLNREKKWRRLIKAITPVRKAAGKVRDMDVLIADVLALSQLHGSEALVRLVEHLAKIRVRSARKLRDVVSAQQREARKRLKQSAKFIRKQLENDSETMSGEAPQNLMTELSHWPELDAGNLHLFRIRIKELRYMLQLVPPDDRRLLDALSDVKDAIGDWHDWAELLKIARKVLDPGSDGQLLQRIDEIGSEKLQQALTAANQLRERYFNETGAGQNGRGLLQMVS
jgi:CHAD domain-containing protein